MNNEQFQRPSQAIEYVVNNATNATLSSIQKNDGDDGADGDGADGTDDGGNDGVLDSNEILPHQWDIPCSERLFLGTNNFHLMMMIMMGSGDHSDGGVMVV